MLNLHYNTANTASSETGGNAASQYVLMNILSLHFSKMNNKIQKH